MNFELAENYLTELLKINSVESEEKEGKPFGEGVYECLEKALDILKREGFRVKNGNGYYGYGEIGEGELFGILCHLDVVPEGKGWHYPPFGAVKEDNKIYARGALDDKAPFIEVLYAIKKLIDDGFVPNKRIRIILGCDEESGWKCMDEYKSKEEMPVLGFSPDGDFPVINCEKGIVYHKIGYRKPEFLISLCAGERANMVPEYAEARIKNTFEIREAIAGNKDAEIAYDGGEMLIKCVGKAAHGSRPQDGENALMKLLRCLAPVWNVAKELSEAFKGTTGEGVGLRISDKVSGELTHNLGTAFTEGEEVLFELDIRHPVTYKKEYVTEELKKHLTGKVEETFFHLPLYVDKKHPLVQNLLAAYNKVTGDRAEPISIGGGTYARVLPVGVAFGPCFPNSPAGIHCADEYIDLDEFKLASKIYYEALKYFMIDPTKSY